MAGRGTFREEWSPLSATSMADLQAHGYDNMITTRFSENGPMLLIATNRDMDLVAMSREDIMSNIRRGDAVVFELTGKLRALSPDELADTGVYLPPERREQGFRAEARREMLEDYRSSIEQALAVDNMDLAIARAVAQRDNAPRDTQGEMTSIFRELTGLDEMNVTDSRRIAAAVTRVREGAPETTTRVAEVTEERRETAMPTEQQRAVDVAMFETGVTGFTQANGPQSIREGQLASAVSFYDRIISYAPEQAEELQRMFREGTGLDINDPQTRERVSQHLDWLRQGGV